MLGAAAVLVMGLQATAGVGQESHWGTWHATRTAFECLGYAGILEMKENNQRFLEAGAKHGRELIDALQNGRIRKNEVDGIFQGGPWRGITPGPTDFVLGRLAYNIDYTIRFTRWSDSSDRKHHARQAYRFSKCDEVAAGA